MNSVAAAGGFPGSGGGFADGYGNDAGASPAGFAGPGGGGGGLGFGGMRPQSGGAAVREPMPATSPAPETATWAMLVTGIGVTGGSMRYRRRQPITA